MRLFFESVMVSFAVLLIDSVRSSSVLLIETRSAGCLFAWVFVK